MFGDTPTRIGKFVLKFRWPIIIFNCVVLIGLVAGLANRGKVVGEHGAYMAKIRNNPLAADSSHVTPPPFFDADYHVWFEDDNPELVAYDKFQQIFSKEENLIIVVVAKNGDLFNNRNLATLKYITDQSWTLPYVSRVSGMTNFNYTYVDDDDLLVEDFIDDIPLTRPEMLEKKKRALEDPLMPKFLISQKGDITQIQLQVIIPRDFPNGFLEAREGMEKLVKKFTEPEVIGESGEVEANIYYNPDIEIRLAGTVMMNTAFQKFAQDDVQNLIPFMFLFIMIFLAVSLRSFWGTISPVLLLLTSVVFPIALFIGLMNLSLTNASTNVVQMLVAVAIADSVHVLAIFFRGLRNGLDKRHSVIYTVEKNFLPCMITSITTAIGFFSLMVQDIPPFQDLGLFAGSGTLYAFFASVFTLPAFLSLLPFRKREVDHSAIEAHEEKGWEWLANFVYKYQKSIRYVALVTSVFALYFVFQIKMDNTAVKYFADHTEFRQATKYIDENIIGVNPIEFNFDSGEDNGIYDPAYLNKLERFQDFISEHPEFEITYVASIVDIIKRINKTMHGDDPAYYRIPVDGELSENGEKINARRLIAQYLLLYQMSLPQGMSLTNQIDIRNRSTRVTAFVRSISSFELMGHAKKIEAWLQDNNPESAIPALGVPIMFGRLFTVAIPGMLKSLMISFVFITIVLMITFKSLRIGFFSMIPNIWPITFVFGVIGLLQIPVNMSVAIVGMITLGIAVDDTVHYLTKYLKGKHEGLDQKAAILYAFRQVAAPLVFTSVILIAGFGALTYSDFVLNSDMAFYCTMVIALALFADFILLPATILKFDRTESVK
ncbi:MAG: hypothetical protein DWQ05_16320 [Calditrichaeota bacterium]|nr:MAG: hypothetical protein DWQ05_16320 [Calditrichota bacterium]